MKKLLLFALLSCCYSLPAAGTFNPNGEYKDGILNFSVTLFNNKWRSFGHWIFKAPEHRGNTWKATFNQDGLAGSISETYKNKTLDVQIKFNAPTAMNSIRGAWSFPLSMRQIKINGVPLDLPEKYQKGELYSSEKGGVITLDLSPGKRFVLHLDNPFTITDARRYKRNYFSIAVLFSPASGKLTETSLKMRYEILDAKMTPVDISKSANSSFRCTPDGIGWTGQGPENDLRMIPAGELRTGAFRFNVLPSSGKSAIILGRSNHNTAEITLPETTRGKGFNILHANAWPPLGNECFGKIEVTFADGSKQEFSVRNMAECGNWWAPRNLTNAFVAYRYNAVQNSYGLYAAGFEMKRDDPRKIRLINQGKNVLWMIGGISISDIPVLRNTRRPPDVTVTPGKELIPITFKRNVVPGSALDFSWVADAPAGKYGFIKVGPDGDLCFEKAPQKKIRLFGANLCYSAATLTHEQSLKMAQELRRQGYNSMRLHHFDCELKKSGQPSSLVFDPQKLDRIDFLIKALKDQGIYVTIDLSSARKPHKSEFDGAGTKGLKQLVLLSSAARENFKEYARKLMTHVNPHTGLRWVDDPAIWAINILNENTITVLWNRPDKAVQNAYDQWRCSKGLAPESADWRPPSFRRFAYEREDSVQSELMQFLRKELGVKSLLSNLNFGVSPQTALSRAKLDIVDNHVYFDHPSYPEKMWSLPTAHQQKNALQQAIPVPRFVAGTRITGKPFMITEYNYCYPNIYRSQGGLITGAYAALQNYSALYRFAWAHHWRRVVGPAVTSGFDNVNDPISRLSDLLTSSLFVRRDASPSRKIYSVKISESSLDGDLPRDFPFGVTQLVLTSRTGSHVDTPAKNVEVLSLDNAAQMEKLNKQAEKNIAISDNGEIHLDSKKSTFRVITPRTEAVVLNKGDLKAGLLQVRKVNKYATIAAISLDEKALKESKSILLLHLTNAICDGIVLNSDWTLTRRHGKPQMLAQRGKAEIILNTGKDYRITALTVDGEPLGEITGRRNGSQFIFTADTACRPEAVLAYHLTVK